MLSTAESRQYAVFSVFGFGQHTPKIASYLVIPAQQSVRKCPKLVIPAKQCVRKCPKPVIPAQAGIQMFLIINDINYTLYRILSIFPILGQTGRQESIVYIIVTIFHIGNSFIASV